MQSARQRLEYLRSQAAKAPQVGRTLAPGVHQTSGAVRETATGAHMPKRVVSLYPPGKLITPGAVREQATGAQPPRRVVTIDPSIVRKPQVPIREQATGAQPPKRVVSINPPVVRKPQVPIRERPTGPQPPKRVVSINPPVVRKPPVTVQKNAPDARPPMRVVSISPASMAKTFGGVWGRDPNNPKRVVQLRPRTPKPERPFRGTEARSFQRSEAAQCSPVDDNQPCMQADPDPLKDAAKKAARTITSFDPKVARSVQIKRACREYLAGLPRAERLPHISRAKDRVYSERYEAAFAGDGILTNSDSSACSSVPSVNTASAFDAAAAVLAGEWQAAEAAEAEEKRRQEKSWEAEKMKEEFGRAIEASIDRIYEEEQARLHRDSQKKGAAEEEQIEDSTEKMMKRLFAIQRKADGALAKTSRWLRRHGQGKDPFADSTISIAPNQPSTSRPSPLPEPREPVKVSKRGGLTIFRNVPPGVTGSALHQLPEVQRQLEQIRIEELAEAKLKQWDDEDREERRLKRLNAGADKLEKQKAKEPQKTSKQSVSYPAPKALVQPTQPHSTFRDKLRQQLLAKRAQESASQVGKEAGATCGDDETSFADVFEGSSAGSHGSYEQMGRGEKVAGGEQEMEQVENSYEGTDSADEAYLPKVRPVEASDVGNDATFMSHDVWLCPDVWARTEFPLPPQMPTESAMGWQLDDDRVSKPVKMPLLTKVKNWASGLWTGLKRIFCGEK